MTLKVFPRCPACDGVSKKYFQIDVSIGYSYLRCKECNSLFLNAPLEMEFLVNFYNNRDNYINFEPNSFISERLNQLIQSFEIFRTSNNSILDIGIGAGMLLMEASKLDWQCSGNDYSEESEEIARKMNWNFYKGNLQDGILPGPFDVVTIIETLEHTQTPIEMLESAEKRLRVGGFLYGTTPNAASLNMKLLKEKAPMFIFPNHPILLTKKGLRIMLLRAGFQDIKVTTKGFNPFSILNFLLFFELFKKREKTNRVDFGYMLNSKLNSNSVNRLLLKSIQMLLKASMLGDTLEFKAIK